MKTESKFTEQQLKDWKAFERVRRGARYNMFDPRARRLSGLGEDKYRFCLHNYSELKTAVESQDNARAQGEPHGLVRAGNSIEWYKCNCGEQSNLLWTFKSNKSRILGCCLDCALKVAKGQVKLGYLMDE